MPNFELEWGLAQAAHTQSPACLHPLHPVETCQAASPKALHLFERMLERKCIAYHLPPSLGVFIVIGDHFGPHGCGFRTHSLCSYVKQLWEKINRKGRFSLSDGRRREVGSGGLELHTQVLPWPCAGFSHPGVWPGGTQRPWLVGVGRSGTMSSKLCELACDLEEFTWGLSRPYLLEGEILNWSKT